MTTLLRFPKMAYYPNMAESVLGSLSASIDMKASTAEINATKLNLLITKK